MTDDKVEEVKDGVKAQGEAVVVGKSTLSGGSRPTRVNDRVNAQREAKVVGRRTLSGRIETYPKYSVSSMLQIMDFCG